MVITSIVCLCLPLLAEWTKKFLFMNCFKMLSASDK
jgi:hypothetical protein